MPALPPDFYSRWRAADRTASPGLAESSDTPPERWLQQVWRHQRLRRGELVALDGRPVQVLHPGFWNRGPGPDFQRAVIQFGREEPVSGDVEIDVGTGGWRQHGHDRNERYRNVVLHVVWASPACDLRPPVLALLPFLEAPLAELVPWLDDEAPSLLPPETLGQCCAPLAQVTPEALAALLRQAALVRLQRKAGEFALRGRLVGWEQALWEGLFGALGYRHNVWPMRRLAELVAPGSARTSTPPEPSSPLAWEARLLGLAGLLPAQLPRGENGQFIKSLWETWWRERDAWSGQILPASTWQWAGLRPANHPQRRLALAARWLAGPGLAGLLEDWLRSSDDAGGNFVDRLFQIFSPALATDDFWIRHWTLRSPRLPKPQPLLGLPRLTDLAVNIVLPWLHARATVGGNGTLKQEIERRYFAWPASEDNAVLKLTRNRLLGGGTRRLPRTAAAQQGLLQISRDFCDRANALCSGCRFPELIRALPGQTPG